jgi:hypothetical protein
MTPRAIRFRLMTAALLLLVSPAAASGAGPADETAPLYRDPVFDGAADPSLVWNDRERAWWMFYTNRRANARDAQDGVRWCHGTDIGIASSADGGRTWTYRGTARGLAFEPGRNTFWAPCLLEHGRVFHMFLAYVRGVPADWSGARRIVHYTSRDLLNWTFEGVLALSSERVIDAFVHPRPEGGWRMWYKDEADGSHVYAADSEDLYGWTVRGPVLTGAAQEGPAVFFWKDRFWMIVDRWQGMAVLSSPDLLAWTEQPGTILGVPGTRADDGDIGRHGEVVVQGRDALLFYFTHPHGVKDHVKPGLHRSSIQGVRLELAEGRIVCDRNKPFLPALKPPGGFRPDVRPESQLRLETSDAGLAEAFAWAKAQALDYVFPVEETGDAVGDWYEAALPSRFAFCMRDVSHQASGAHVLGLARFNLNMLGKFAAAASPSRDYCSYWEIDKYNRPAPVDYKNDRDFWYNLPSSFDVLDACWRQFLWTGDRAYLDAPVFKAFYEKTVNEYVRAWDKDGDGIPEHRPEYGNRGLGSYDEGPYSGRTLMGSDLIAAMARAYRSYADLLGFGGDDKAAAGWVKKADRLRGFYMKAWWSDKLGRFAPVLFQDRTPAFEDAYWADVFPLYFDFIPAGPRRRKVLEALLTGTPGNIEIRSYLPETLFRLGREEAAYAELLRLCDPATERREYPEVSFAVIGAVATGLLGIRPDARERLVVTRSGLTAATEWAELRNVPVFGSAVAVRHRGRDESSFEVGADGEAIDWKAVFPGRLESLLLDGAARPAARGRDDNGRDVSWIVVRVGPGERHTVAAPSSR